MNQLEQNNFNKYIDLNHRYYILVPTTEESLNDLYDAKFLDADEEKIKETYKSMVIDEESYLLMEEYLFNFINVQTELIITMYEEEWAEKEDLNKIAEIAKRMIKNSDDEKFIKLANEFLNLVEFASNNKYPVVFYF